MMTRLPNVPQGWTTGYIIGAGGALTLLCWSRPFGKAAYVTLTVAVLLWTYRSSFRLAMSFVDRASDEWRSVSTVTAITIANLVFIVGLFGNLYRAFGLKGDDGPTYKLLECIYFSCITLTTVGFGDFHPFTTLGRLTSIAEAFSGFFLLALISGTLGSLLRKRA